MESALARTTETDEAKQLVETYRTAGAELLAQAERAVIDSPEAAENMTDMLKVVKMRKTKSEEARKSLVKPLNDHVKFINEQFKDAAAPLVQADHIGRRKLTDYMREQERIRREEEARIRKEEEERRLVEAEKLEQAGDADGAEKALEEAIHVPAAPRAAPTRGNFASSHTRKVWTHKLVDLSEVPAEFLMLDEKAVKRAIDSGTREIPGLEIYQDEQISIR